MRKRLFLAIPLHKGFLKSLSRYRDEMGKKTLYARWTAVANLHVTVLFLGDVDETKIPQLIDVLRAELKSAKSFSLEFSKIIYAPPNKPSRMIWGAFEESGEYEALTESVVGAARAAGVPVDDNHEGKEKTPHITLARFKRNVFNRELIRLKKTGLEGEEMAVPSIALMESFLGRNGAHYKTLAVFSFDKNSIYTDT